jgi:hypothetical protein
VLGPRAPEFAGEQRPPAAELHHQREELDVLLHAPPALLHARVRVVDPLLAALLERPEVPVLGSHEQAVGDELPVLRGLVPGSGIAYLLMLKKIYNYSLSHSLAYLSLDQRMQ